LFAYAQWFTHVGDDDDRYTRIEAAPHGWWYSNRLPSTEGNEIRRLVVLHTDKDLPAARMAACRQGFDRLLDDSTHIAPLLKARGYHPCGTIRGAPANSQRLRDFCGDAWMAVGDAAQAYDPLSSHGIYKALRTASHACACRKLNPNILVVQPAQDRAAKNGPGQFDGARDRRILLQR
jgi:hypothetical protein